MTSRAVAHEAQDPTTASQVDHSPEEGSFILLLDFFLDQQRRQRIGEKLRRSVQRERRILGPELEKRIANARRKNDPKTAFAVLEVLVALELASVIASEELVWTVNMADRLGMYCTSLEQSIQLALRQWLYHHGPCSRGVVALAEARQREAKTLELDELVLWIEPTPARWKELADRLWESLFRQQERPSDEPAERPPLDGRLARFDRIPKRILEERGDPAWRALRAAAYDPSRAQPILQDWVRRAGSDTWRVR